MLILKMKNWRSCSLCTHTIKKGTWNLC